MGREFRVLAWLLRHPAFPATPVVLTLAVTRWGPITVAVTVLAVLLILVGWRRGHPTSFDLWAAPRLRTIWRRWTAYRGGWWRRVLEDCDLVHEHRRTTTVSYPAIRTVRAVTASIDVLTVRMVRGQDLRVWTDRLPALTEALQAERVALTRTRPGLLTLVVERRMPFTDLIDATTMPATPGEVDLTAVPIGEDEYGQPFPIRVRGRHLLVVGGSGAGKSGPLWNGLRGLTPLIRDGLVRVCVIDLKGGTETERGQEAFYRWATTLSEAVTVLTEFRDSMRERQQWMRTHRVRTCPITVETPLLLLVIDEMAMLTAYGEPRQVRTALALLAEILTQGRAADHTVWGFVQEPTKDVVDVRDLFNQRLCLGVNAASHVDMALGDGARERGALADEIPGDPEHAGIGFAIHPVTRAPVRFRAGLVEDHEIDDFARAATPTPYADGDGEGDGEVLTFRDHRSNSDGAEDTNEGDDGEEDAS